MVPLSARTYLDAYYEGSEIPETLRREMLLLLDRLEGFRLIPTAVPVDIWPDGGWRQPHDSNVEPQLAAMDCEDMTTGEHDKPKSLRDHAMEKLVQTLVDDPECAREVTPEAELLTDFWPRMKEYFYEHAEKLRASPALLDLLSATLKEETYVNLSPFQTFTCKDLSKLVWRLQGHGKWRRLNLSNMPNLTSEGLASVLNHGRTPRYLCVYLMENPQISIESLCTLKCACDLYHSELLRRSIVHKPLEPDTNGERDSTRSPLSILDFPVGGNAVTQFILIGLTEDQTLAERYRKPDGSLFWETFIAATEPPTTSSLHGTDRLQYNAISLVNVPFSSTRLVTGFLNLLEWCSKVKAFPSSRFSIVAARSFALGFTSSADSSNSKANGVGPLSAELYLTNGGRLDHLENKQNVSSIATLLPGQWAIVMVQECCDKGLEKRRIKYALVSPAENSKASPGNFRVADMPEYLDEVAKDSPVYAGVAQSLRKCWKANMSRNSLGSISFYHEKDLQDILQMIYGSAEGVSTKPNIVPIKVESQGDTGGQP